ncbi:MAG: class I SAM-dependent methyltransferase [Acidobacteriota bacterium]|nr:class I SAM-dependent methyltransferase [Acidobacteriota bacterium]
MGQEQPLVKVRQLIEELGVDGACRTAEEYFAQLEPSILAKPFNNINETPELLSCFAQLLQGLKLFPGLVVLDFGSGSCWTSRFLTQLGLKVIALDVSATALKVGRELYDRQPLFGDQPEPAFLHFDGRRIEIPDRSVDRIFCFDALHHTPNPGEVLAELGRVLKPGGIAGFSEPGPEHSKLQQSQAEMRMYRTVENDIHIEEIYRLAQSSGFTNMKLAVFNPALFLLQPEEFQERLVEGQKLDEYLEETRAYQQDHRVFFLYKGESSTPDDSRQQSGLLAELDVKLQSTRIAVSDRIACNVVVKNTGTSVWLPTTGIEDPADYPLPILDEHENLLKQNLRPGAVHLGMHLFDRQGQLIERDFSRHLLTQDARRIQPGETLSFTATLKSPPKGSYCLEFDLVSEWVCWFEANGSKTVRVNLDVV